MSDSEPISPGLIQKFKQTDQRELSLHIFNPPQHKESESRPAIVFFFGGGWKGGHPRQFYPHCEYFSKRGLVAISAEYRTENQDGTSPKDCVKDGKSAIRWVKQNAGILGIDPNKVIAGGGSAGGHVAAACGTLEGFNEDGEDLSISPRPEALVLFNPVIDNGPHGYGYERVGEYWEEFSPMNNLSPDTPPTIFHMGTDDRLLPVETGEEYQRLMKENGTICDLILYPDQKHGFFNYESSLDNFNKTISSSDDFLVELGFLDPK